MKDEKNRAEETLARPYSRLLTQQPDGGWVAEIREIPGCHGVGKTQSDALEALKKHALELVEVYLRKGQPIPPPFPNEFSGNFALRMPKGVHQRAAQLASWEGTSLNQFVVAAVAERIGYASRPVLLPVQSITFVASAELQISRGAVIGNVLQSGTPAYIGQPPPGLKLRVMEK